MDFRPFFAKKNNTQCISSKCQLFETGELNTYVYDSGGLYRTRDDPSGTRSGVGAGGGAVALMVELLSVYLTMPESAPLSSYRRGNEVRVWGYREALAALRQVAARAGDDLSEVALHSLRIGATTTLAVGGTCHRG